VQTVLAQDPFVRVTLEPWGHQAKTKVSSGTNPTWKDKNATMMINYPGRPVPPAQPGLLVEVMDAEVTRAARLIGKCHVDLKKWMHGSTLGIKREIELDLVDKKDSPAGKLFLDFEVVLKGLIDLKVLRVHNLKNIEKSQFFELDPYVMVEFTPILKGKKAQLKQTKPGTGTSFEYGKKHRNKMSFEYDAETDAKLMVTVYDKEWVHKDRLVGRGALDLQKKVLSAQSNPETKTTVTVDIVDESFAPAGRVKLEVKFKNEAFDENVSNVVRGLSTRQLSVKSFNNFKGLSAMQSARKLFYSVEGQLEDSAPDFMQGLEGTFKLPLSALVAAFWTIVIAVSLAMLVTRGARFLSIVLGVTYPVYASFKAIESDEKEDDTQWLTYWMVFGVFSLSEETVLKIPALMQPMSFFLIKLVFLIWLSHPSTHGAAKIYNSLVAPILRRYEARIDKNIQTAGKKIREVNEKIRIEPDKEEEEIEG